MELPGFEQAVLVDSEEGLRIYRAVDRRGRGGVGAAGGADGDDLDDERRRRA